MAFGLAMFVSACGGGTDAHTAVIGVVDTQLAHAPEGADFAAAEDGQPVQAGDLVRTDDTGFGEVRYADGSLVRLDVETTVEVLDLSFVDDELEVSVQMQTPGRSWHRVADGVAGYEVRTAVGTASVRGTSFIVTCEDDGTCRVEVLEGEVDVTGASDGEALVAAPAAVTMLADGTLSEVEPIRLVDAVDDLWAGRNVERDQEQGLAPIGDGQLAQRDDVVGFWSGDWGRMVIREDGDQVRATFDHDQGTITGRLVGGVLHGWWCEVPSRDGPSDAGPVQFRFVQDDDGTFRLDGRWKYAGDGADGAWRENWDLAPDGGDPPEDLVARFADDGAFCPAP